MDRCHSPAFPVVRAGFVPGFAFLCLFELLSVVSSVGALLRYLLLCGGTLLGSSGVSASQSVLEFCLRPIVCGNDAGARPSPRFSSIPQHRRDFIFRICAIYARSHRALCPASQAFIFLICAVLIRTASARYPLHFFPLLPPGLAARMMLRRSCLRGVQIGFQRCRSWKSVHIL